MEGQCQSLTRKVSLGLIISQRGKHHEYHVKGKVELALQVACSLGAKKWAAKLETGLRPEQGTPGS